MKFKEMDLEMYMLFLGGFLLLMGTISTMALVTSGNYFWILSLIITVIGYFLIRIDWKDAQINENTRKKE